ncbi:outer membrane protein [Phreatobacter oligotrophus]|uniref:Outer membrane immunogenic protein n=1 Tax=Phreatobacter oligotrophus TaxID=1122261 RepID=A0A2T4Z1A0_9HYPH|nr:outer membrane protein [Phreatobacter oligotrophus]PTM53492.1 outer membrane immunogenic protein [Phreatobacter oligotrophus]
MKTTVIAAAALIALPLGAGAADLGAVRAPSSAAVAAQAFDWSGFYLGAHAGYGFGRALPVNFGGVPFPTNVGGALIGGQVGFNYQINQVVLGAEADLALTSISGSNPVLPPAIRVRTHVLGTLRARAGFAVDRALIYGTGGLAVQSATFGYGPGPQGYSRVGWTIGAGVEYALAPHWTVKAEYAYHSFGSRDLLPLYGLTISSNIHTVKLGVNYLFSTGPSAVSARY